MVQVGLRLRRLKVYYTPRDPEVALGDPPALLKKPDTNPAARFNPGNSNAVPTRRDFRRKPRHMLELTTRHGEKA